MKFLLHTLLPCMAVIIMATASTLRSETVVQTAPAGQFLKNPGFESGKEGWALPPAGAAVVQEGAHDGKACLRFASESADWSRADQRTTVAKDTYMTASGWVRPESGVAEIRLILRDAEGKYLVGCEVDVGMAKGARNWVYFEKIFNTGAAEKIDFWLRVKGTGAMVRFDGLSLVAGCPKVRNHLRNSGFSICATPGYPSWWGVSVQYPIATKDWETGRYYGVAEDERSPVPGAKVLRICSDKDMDVVPFALKPLPKGTYTASAYLKAEGDLSVELAIPDCASKKFKPESVWKRFQFTFTGTCQPCIRFKINGAGVLWIAAPQLEDGDTATSWVPSVFDGSRLAADGAVPTAIVPRPEGLDDHGRTPGIKAEISNAKIWKFICPRLSSTADGSLAFSCCLESPGNIGNVITVELSAAAALPGPRSCEMKMEAVRASLRFDGLPADLDPSAMLKLRLTRKGEKEPLAEFSSRVLYLLNPQADAVSPLRALAEFSWYPKDVATARVRVEWLLDEPADISLTLGGKTVSAFSQVLSFKGRQTEIVQVPLGRLANGSYRLDVVATVGGLALASTRDIVVKRTPPSSGVRLNRFLRCFEVDGKPYFPIIFHPSDRDLLEDWQLERLAKQGFNCLVPITPPRIKERPVEAMKAMLDRCVNHKFKTIFWIDSYTAYGRMESPKSMDQCREGLTKIMKDFRDHPAGLAWYIMDEPGHEYWEGKCKYKETDLKLLYETAVATDPDRPVTINYCTFSPANPLYGGYDSQDFSMLDVYPWYPDERTDALDYFAKNVKSFNDLLEPMGRVTPFWLQTWGTRDAFREPTPDEWQNTVYCSLIHGTRGLAYFMCQPYSIPLWKRMGEVHARIRSLEPVIFHRDVETVRGVQNNSVHYAVWSTPDSIHVMVANVAESPAKIFLDLRRITGHEAGTGKILFEKDGCGFEEGRLVDALAPGQSRVYRFERGWFRLWPW